MVNAVLKELHKCHVGKLNGFEQIKRLHLNPEPFHEDLITPTMKIKRQVAGKHFKDIIDKLYAASDAAQAAAGGEKRQWKL